MKVKHVQVPGQFGYKPLTECSYSDEAGRPMSARLIGHLDARSAQVTLSRLRAIDAQQRKA